MDEGYLHPAPAPDGRVDHRDTANRDQECSPTDLHAVWKNAVERLAADLQIEPINAHSLLRDAEAEVTIGLAWRWWYW